jgi:predicted nucleic acid-binding protein
MVLIHLAKLTILEESCNYFQNILIPELVYKEILKGKKKSFPDVTIILEFVKHKKITIKRIKQRSLIKKANQFNIQKGEAEVISLYWQENANLIATEDDNVRKKKTLLNINVIGTPAIILRLFKEKQINKEKIIQCVSELKKIGWFSSTILDKLLMEVKNE